METVTYQCREADGDGGSKGKEYLRWFVGGLDFNYTSAKEYYIAMVEREKYVESRYNRE